jgi:hypothetical protein
MTDTPTPPQNAPQEPVTGAVGIDPQDVIAAYSQELANATQQRIITEAALAKVQRELAEARMTIRALSPGAPTIQEN